MQQNQSAKALHILLAGVKDKKHVAVATGGSDNGLEAHLRHSSLRAQRPFCSSVKLTGGTVLMPFSFMASSRLRNEHASSCVVLKATRPFGMPLAIGSVTVLGGSSAVGAAGNVAFVVRFRVER
eukprot:6177439-Pleurochrysis_carterae.AAC.2